MPVCAGPASLPLVALVRVAGTRWRVEEAFQASKGLCGLDQHQVRRWRSWYRWVTLAMLAHAFLVVAALLQRIRHPPPPELLPLTGNEVSHLFVGLAASVLALLAWVAVQSLSAAVAALSSPARSLLPSLAALCGFGVMVASIATFPPPWTQVERLSKS